LFFKRHFLLYIYTNEHGMKILLAALILLANYTYAQLPKIENGKLVLDDPVTFKTGSAELTGDGKEALNRRMEFIPAALRGKAIGRNRLDGGGVIAGDPCQ
jgi:hypothetical protein